MTTANKPQDRVPPMNLGKPKAAVDTDTRAVEVDSQDHELENVRQLLEVKERVIASLEDRIKELSRPKVPVPASGELSVTQVCLARLAMRLGLKVLAYKLKPGERVANADGAAWIVTVSLPDGLGQLCFSFSEQQALLLAGIPNSAAFPIERRELLLEDFEALVRAMLAFCPEALKVAEESPWRGQDGSPASHERLMQGV